MRNKTVYFMIGFLIFCLSATSCGDDPTPTPIAEVAYPTIELAPANNQTVLIIGEETAFYVGIQPSSQKGQVASVNVHGDKGIDCKQSEADMWTWYCTGWEAATAATVFAEIEGANFPPQTTRYSVAVEEAPAPIPSPSDIPQPTPENTPTFVLSAEASEVAPTVLPSPEPTPTDGPLPPGTVTLTNPKDKDPVPCENITEGEYADDVMENIWPVVYVGSRFHPQDEGGEAARKINGEWYQTVRFGNCDKPDDDVGLRFQLIVVVANEQCNQAFETYIADSARVGEFPGLLEMPEGCVEALRIVVTRE